MSVPVVWKSLRPECRVALVGALLATFLAVFTFVYVVLEMCR
jgi:hypothetical protein